MCWRNFISRINPFFTKCLFAAVKLVPEWPDKRLSATARLWVLWNLSDATQWLGHRHYVWRHVGYTNVWDTNCRWAIGAILDDLCFGINYSIMIESTLVTPLNRITNGVFYVVETHSGVSLSCQTLQCLRLVHTVASVEAALLSGEKFSPHRAD